MMGCKTNTDRRYGELKSRCLLALAIFSTAVREIREPSDQTIISRGFLFRREDRAPNLNDFTRYRHLLHRTYFRDTFKRSMAAEGLDARVLDTAQCCRQRSRDESREHIIVGRELLDEPKRNLFLISNSDAVRPYGPLSSP